MNGYYDPEDYDGLTDEEIAAMWKDTERDRFKAGSKPIWTSKTKLGYTPIFIGKSGAVYVGGVKLEGGYGLQKARAKPTVSIHFALCLTQIEWLTCEKRQEQPC